MEIVGKTVLEVKVEGNRSVLFICEDRDSEQRIAFEISHMQECCETVRLFDIIGDITTIGKFKILVL